jgi:hypothetical protein
VTAIHRWRAVVDYYDYEATQAEPVEDRAEFIREQFTRMFPCGVVEGYPDVYDQDAMRAQLETPLDV